MMKSKQFGLVLSGGGIRGVAHIGLLKVLIEHDLIPSYISGASAGAVVGALFAAGHDTSTMLSYFKKANIFDFRRYTYYKPGLLDSISFLKETKKLFKTDDFSSLNIPLFISTTNLNTGENEISSEGVLLRRILASAALPPVFSPVRINGDLYADGGITNNFPVEPLLNFEYPILGSYVNPIGVIKDNEIKSTAQFINRSFHLAIYQKSAIKFDQVDYLFMPKSLNEISIMGTKQIDEAYDIGYREALLHIDKIIDTINS